jgi:TolB-like protein/Tfp pilus assembly protein PilF
MVEPTWSQKHGKALRNRRQQRGLTQESLAEAAGVSVNTIKNLEHGARQPRASTLQLIADTLKCGADDLQEGRRVPSIAVLPFKNLSGDEDQEPLCAGLTEELINAVVHLPGLKVAARTSSFYFKDKDVELGAIGEALGVQHVLEGSVQRSGDQLRITAQLVQVDDGFHIWSERFDHQLTEIFAIQDEIVANVIKKLRIGLFKGEIPGPKAPPTSDLAAYELFLKGAYLVMQATATGFRQGIGCVQQAIEKDPKFALAHAWIAGAIGHQVAWGYAPARDALSLARTSATRALEIDDSIGIAHALLAYCAQMLDWDWAGARRLYDRALACDPANALCRSAYGTFLIQMGQLREAIEEARRAAELDPLSAAAAHDLGIKLTWAEEWDEALLASERAVECDPTRGWALITLAHCKLRADRCDYDEVVDLLKRGSDMAGRHAPVIGSAAVAYAMAGHEGETRAILEELKSRSEDEYVSPYFIARIHAELRESDEGFLWFDRALDARDPMLYIMHFDYAIESLRNDPRYHAIVGHMGLAPHLL